MQALRNSGLIALLLALPAVAQVIAPDDVTGAEIFVTMDTDGLPPTTCDLIAFVFRDLDGQFADFMFPPGWYFGSAPGPGPNLYFAQDGHGVWGPQYERGEFIVEPFWLSQALGNHGGQLHIYGFFVPPPLPGPFGGWHPYEQLPAVTGMRYGLRFARVDGRPLSLVSFDYRMAAGDFQIGTQLLWYPSFAGYMRVSPILGAGNAETIQFPLPPESIREIVLDGASSTGLVFSPSLGTFSSTAGTISSVRRPSGVIVDDPAADPLIHGTVTIAGTYTGADLLRFSDIHLTSATLSFTSTTGDVLTMSAAFSPATLEWKLVGPLQAAPVSERTFTQDAIATVTRTGSSSDLLDSMELLLPHDLFHFRLRLTNSGPRLVTIGRGPVAAPFTGMTHAIAGDGMGGLQIGLIGAAPNAEIRHLIQVAPMGALGAGMFFGLDLTSELMMQLQLPLGVHPFRIAASNEGTYHWTLPPGSIPLGIIVDAVLIEMTTPLVTAQPPIRVVF